MSEDDYETGLKKDDQTDWNTNYYVPGNYGKN